MSDLVVELPLQSASQPSKQAEWILELALLAAFGAVTLAWVGTWIWAGAHVFR